MWLKFLRLPSEPTLRGGYQPKAAIPNTNPDKIWIPKEIIEVLKK